MTEQKSVRHGTTGPDEMTRNVADAAKGSEEISHNIEGVAQAAQGTSTSAQESQKATNEVNEISEQLGGVVSQFKISGNAQSGPTPIGSAKRPLTMAARAGK
jgi:methyl-accepting chemotaxis protein